MEGDWQSPGFKTPAPTMRGDRLRTERKVMDDGMRDLVADIVRNGGPEPGLDGTYRDSCTVCLGPTDSAIGIRGPVEAAAAALVVLGVPIDEAIDTVTELYGGDPPGGDTSTVIRVCEPCTEGSPFHPGVVAVGHGVPTYGPGAK